MSAPNSSRACAAARVTAPSPEEIARALRAPLVEVFPPALLGRVAVIPYYPLDDAMLDAMIRLQLARIERRIVERHRVSFSYDDAMVRQIARALHRVRERRPHDRRDSHQHRAAAHERRIPDASDRWPRTSRKSKSACATANSPTRSTEREPKEGSCHNKSAWARRCNVRSAWRRRRSSCCRVTACCCEGPLAANIMDHVPLVNIMPFGMCTSPANPAGGRGDRRRARHADADALRARDRSRPGRPARSPCCSAISRRSTTCPPACASGAAWSTIVDPATRETQIP